MQKNYVLPALAMFCIIALLLHGPIPQNQDYHHFADQRKMFGIPNFFNVITNIPYELIDQKTGYKAFIILNLLGIMSVVYWHLGERQGIGDLRWYAIVQFFPVIAIPLILILYKSSFDHRRNVILVFLFFGLAKLAESFDKETYHLLNQVISGHSIKHLFMAGVEYSILRLIARRVKIAQ